MVKTSKIKVLLKTCLAYIHSITCLSFAGKLSPEELSFLAGWHHHGACWEQGEPLSSGLISSYDSPKTYASTLREPKMKRALGPPCRRKMIANPPGNFSIQGYGMPGYTTEPCTSRQGSSQPHSWRPSGMFSSTQPCTTARLPRSQSHTHAPRNHSLTISRACYLQVSADAFCCCCTCLVSNILGSFLKQPSIRSLLYRTAATHHSKTNSYLLDATGNQQESLCPTEQNCACWVALGDPEAWQGPPDMAWKLYKGYAQLIAVTCYSERTLSLPCQQEERGNQEPLPLPEAVNQLGFAPRRAVAPAELRIINLRFHSHLPPACPSFWTLGCKWCITLLGLLPGHRNFPISRELKTRLNILVTPVSSLKQMQKTFFGHFPLEFCDKIPCKGWRC